MWPFGQPDASRSLKELLFETKFDALTISERYHVLNALIDRGIRTLKLGSRKKS